MSNAQDSKAGADSGCSSRVNDAKTGLIRIRPMTEQDLGAVLEVERIAYSFPWSDGIFRDCLRVGYCCWVLEHRDIVDAYGIMSVGGGESHVLNLCVRPASHGKGLGGRLLTHLLKTAHSHRADTTLLEVRPTNTRAIQLYERLGFNQVGVRKDYYPDEGGREDALLFAIELSTFSAPEFECR